jgi:predicted nuclease of predicted toxin-antitoxin system
MKLLLDANISWKLVNTLAPVFGECTHVDLLDFSVPAKDEAIWNYALKNGCIIITKDTDFLDLLELKGFPPKVVLIKTGNNSTRILAELLLDAKQQIEDLEKNEYGLLEVYGPLKLVQRIDLRKD